MLSQLGWAHLFLEQWNDIVSTQLWKEAGELADEALQHDAGHDPSTLRLKGILLNRQQRFEEAIPYLRQATQLDPEFGATWAELANALSQSSSWDSFASDFNDCPYKSDIEQYVLGLELKRRADTLWSEGDKTAALPIYKDSITHWSGLYGDSRSLATLSSSRFDMANITLSLVIMNLRIQNIQTALSLLNFVFLTGILYPARIAQDIHDNLQATDYPQLVNYLQSVESDYVPLALQVAIRLDGLLLKDQEPADSPSRRSLDRYIRPALFKRFAKDKDATKKFAGTRSGLSRTQVMQFLNQSAARAEESNPLLFNALADFGISLAIDNFREERAERIKLLENALKDPIEITVSWHSKSNSNALTAGSNGSRGKAKLPSTSISAAPVAASRPATQNSGPVRPTSLQDQIHAFEADILSRSRQANVEAKGLDVLQQLSRGNPIAVQRELSQHPDSLASMASQLAATESLDDILATCVQLADAYSTLVLENSATQISHVYQARSQGYLVLANALSWQSSTVPLNMQLEILRRLAWLLLLQNEADQAMPLIDRGIHLSNQLSFRTYRALGWYSLHQWDQSITEFHYVMGNHIETLDIMLQDMAHFNYAMSLYFRHRLDPVTQLASWEEVALHELQAVKSAPQSPSPHNLRDWLQIRQHIRNGHWSEASQLARQAITRTIKLAGLKFDADDPANITEASRQNMNRLAFWMATHREEVTVFLDLFVFLNQAATQLNSTREAAACLSILETLGRSQSPEHISSNQEITDRYALQQEDPSTMTNNFFLAESLFANKDYSASVHFYQFALLYATYLSSLPNNLFQRFIDLWIPAPGKSPSTQLRQSRNDFNTIKGLLETSPLQLLTLIHLLTRLGQALSMDTSNLNSLRQSHIFYTAATWLVEDSAVIAILTRIQLYIGLCDVSGILGDVSAVIVDGQIALMLLIAAAQGLNNTPVPENLLSTEDIERMQNDVHTQTAIHTGFTTVHFKLGMAHFLRSEWQVVVQYLQQLIDLGIAFPELPQARLLLAWAHYQLGHSRDVILNPLIPVMGDETPASSSLRHQATAITAMAVAREFLEIGSPSETISHLMNATILLFHLEASLIGTEFSAVLPAIDSHIQSIQELLNAEPLMGHFVTELFHLMDRALQSQNSTAHSSHWRDIYGRLLGIELIPTSITPPAPTLAPVDRLKIGNEPLKDIKKLGEFFLNSNWTDASESEKLECLAQSLETAFEANGTKYDKREPLFIRYLKELRTVLDAIPTHIRADADAEDLRDLLIDLQPKMDGLPALISKNFRGTGMGSNLVGAYRPIKPAIEKAVLAIDAAIAEYQKQIDLAREHLQEKRAQWTAVEERLHRAKAARMQEAQLEADTYLKTHPLLRALLPAGDKPISVQAVLTSAAQQLSIQANSPISESELSAWLQGDEGAWEANHLSPKRGYEISQQIVTSIEHRVNGDSTQSMNLLIGKLRPYAINPSRQNGFVQFDYPINSAVTVQCNILVYPRMPEAPIRHPVYIRMGKDESRTEPMTNRILVIMPSASFNNGSNTADLPSEVEGALNAAVYLGIGIPKPEADAAARFEDNQPLRRTSSQRRVLPLSTSSTWQSYMAQRTESDDSDAKRRTLLELLVTTDPQCFADSSPVARARFLRTYYRLPGRAAQSPADLVQSVQETLIVHHELQAALDAERSAHAGDSQATFKAMRTEFERLNMEYKVSIAREQKTEARKHTLEIVTTLMMQVVNYLIDPENSDLLLELVDNAHIALERIEKHALLHKTDRTRDIFKRLKVQVEAGEWESAREVLESSMAALNSNLFLPLTHEMVWVATENIDDQLIRNAYITQPVYFRTFSVHKHGEDNHRETAPDQLLFAIVDMTITPAYFPGQAIAITSAEHLTNITNYYTHDLAESIGDRFDLYRGRILKRELASDLSYAIDSFGIRLYASRHQLPQIIHNPKLLEFTTEELVLAAYSFRRITLVESFDDLHDQLYAIYSESSKSHMHRLMWQEINQWFKRPTQGLVELMADWKNPPPGIPPPKLHELRHSFQELLDTQMSLPSQRFADTFRQQRKWMPSHTMVEMAEEIGRLIEIPSIRFEHKKLAPRDESKSAA